MVKIKSVIGIKGNNMRFEKYITEKITKKESSIHKTEKHLQEQINQNFLALFILMLAIAKVV
jgi:hypothetical protein